MKIKKYVVLGITTVSMALGLNALTTPAHALQNEWKSDHWVTITRSVSVNKYKIVNPFYKSYSVKTYTIKRGSHYKLSHWGVNFSWALQSGKYNSGSHYTYVPDEAYNDGSWFKMGIHKLKSAPKYKSFHGYRVATSKDDYTYNTFYDKSTHCTLSDYRPTQKSKVIFEHGSQVMPTHHEWTWFHGSKKDILTDYRYIGGKWVNKGNE